MLRFEFEYPKTVTSKSKGVVPFDPVHDTSHRIALDRRIAAWKLKHPEAATATLDHIDESRRVAVLVDKTIASVESDGDVKTVSLSVEQMKPSKGEEVRAWYERDNPGWYMTVFHPYAGLAFLERMDDAQRAARAQFAAALGLAEWDVRVTHGEDGGWLLRLDDGVVYQPARMDVKLERACHTVGGPGWWFEADAAKGVIHVHPGEPPTFLKAHPYPFDLLGAPECRDRTPLGVMLPRTGGMDWTQAFVDWTQSSFLLVGGEGGSGKSVFMNAMLANIIAQKPELSIIDLRNKSTDYYWCRPWVTPGHWGCESEVEAAGVLNRLVHEIEHGERAEAWASNAWQNWLDIPRWAKEKYPLHYIVIDEYSSLVDKAKDVPRMPDPSKILPPVIEKQFQGQAQADIRSAVLRLLRTARAQGYRLILVSQTVNDRSGLGPTTRDLFGHHVVMGPNPSEALVKAVFHDPSQMPDVPAQLFEQGVTKGVGRAELMGGRGFVFKTCYAGDDAHADTEALGLAVMKRIGLPDGVDEAKYADSLRRHGEDDPVDGAFMNMLSGRVRLGRDAALRSDPILNMLADALEESRGNFGMDDAGDGAPASASDKPGADDAKRPEEPSDGALMDARALARVMEAG